MFFRNVIRTVFQCINPRTTDDSEASEDHLVEFMDSESEPDYTICTLMEESVVQDKVVQSEVAEFPSWFMDFVEEVHEDSELMETSEGQRDFMEYINDSDDEDYEEDSEAEEDAYANVTLTPSEMEVADTLANFAEYDSGDYGIARARVYTRNPRDELVDVVTATSSPHPVTCSCGEPDCTVPLDRLFHILSTAMSHTNDEDFFREISSISDNTSMLPTQKVTWNVEENTIDWDLKAMCLCGVRDCKLKFGSDKKRNFDNMFTGGFYASEQHRKDMEELERKRKEQEEEAMRDFIRRLEKQKKKMEADEEEVEEQQEEPRFDPLTSKILPPRRKPDFAPSPLTLWSGVPFARMDHEELLKSRSELMELVKNRRVTALIKWRQVGDAQQWLGAERKPGGFVDAMWSDAERMEERVMHLETMLQKVICMLNDDFIIIA